jgi:hypothetical protein
MSDSDAPKRWLEGAAPADPLLSRALASAATDEPGAGDLRALGGQLELALALAPATLALSAAKLKAGTAGAAAGSSAKLLAPAVLSKIGLAVVVSGGLIAGAVHYGRGSGAAESIRAPAPVTHASAGAKVKALPQSSSSEVVADTPIATPVPSATPAPAPRRAPSSARSAVPAASPANSAAPPAREVSSAAAEPKPARTAPAPVASPAEEIALVERAQKSLRHGSASEALALADRHDKEHPNGAVTQESEAIAIEALYRLGRRVEADARRARFRARFPGSPHLRRIDALAARAAPSP